LEPWLCYYCGECTTDCPRDAQPGETMMSLRRWLTSRYDFTGISRVFYRRPRVELLSVIVVALLTGIGFTLFGFLNGDINSYNGPDSFLPASVVHIFDWVLAAILLAFLIPNMIRMWWFTIGRETTGRGPMRLSAGAYLKSVYLFPLHFMTQKRYAQCERKRPWAVHLALMLSYVTMLVLIMFFLEPMQHGPEIRWEVHAFGYLATVGLLAGVWYALRGRVKRDRPSHRHSHGTDWVFLLLLLVVVATGVLLHAAHRLGYDVAANLTYVVHMMAVVPWLARYPFTKWSHLAYRPLAMYFSVLQSEALALREAGREDEPARVAQAA
jgi:quinone-modifying oxidoreductase subunit QmoC